jgi:hypothetical protein
MNETNSADLKRNVLIANSFKKKKKWKISPKWKVRDFYGIMNSACSTTIKASNFEPHGPFRLLFQKG